MQEQVLLIRKNEVERRLNEWRVSIVAPIVMSGKKRNWRRANGMLYWRRKTILGGLKLLEAISEEI